MFTCVLQERKEDKRSIAKLLLQKSIEVLLECKLVDKELVRLVISYEFSQEDIIKEIKGYFLLIIGKN